jgi:DNA-binding response OmpR family regulator
MDWTAPRILIIASEPAVYFTIEELLRSYGYDVATAPNSVSASRLAAEGQFAAILLAPALAAIPGLDRSPPARVNPHGAVERWPVEGQISA